MLRFSTLICVSLIFFLGCNDAPQYALVAQAGAKPATEKGDNPLVVRTAFRVPADDLPRVTFREVSEQEAAAQALGQIGKPAVPSLVQALRHRDPEVRRNAALVLARIGPPAAEAVPELIASLDDQEEGVRMAATRALGQIGPAAAPAVPALMRRLVEPRPLAPQREPLR